MILTPGRALAFAGFALVLALVLPATAQEDGGDAPDVLARQPDEVRPATSLIGLVVRDAAGEPVGEVGDLLIRDGGVYGLVVQTGGFLGVAERPVAVEIGEVIVAPEGLSLAMTRAEVEAAPTFGPLETQPPLAVAFGGNEGDKPNAGRGGGLSTDNAASDESATVRTGDDGDAGGGSGGGSGG